MASRAPASVSPTPAEAVAAPTPSRHRESPRVRTALKISSPGDSAEREAEATAKRVAVMPAIGLGPIARQTPLMAARAPVIPVPRPQAPAGSAAPPATARPPEETSPELTAAIKKELGGGQPLPPDVASFMAPRFKANFSAVRIHTDARAANLATRLGARAFTLGRDIFFNTGQFQPDTKEGTELIAHELTHTIQQREVVQREVAQAAPVEVREMSAPTVQRGIISKALDWIADKANYIPGFRLFTVVIGVNPINMSTVERSGANVIRGLIELIPGGGLIVDALEGYGIFEKVGKWAEEQFRTLGMVGSAFRDALMEFLDSLGWSDIFHPVAVVERAIEIFTRPVKKLIDFGKGLVAGILRFIREAILKPLAALAEGTRGYPLLKAVLGEDPVTGEKVPQTADTLIGGFMTLIGQQEIWENIKKSNAIPRAWAWFKNALKTLFALVSSIPTRFMDTLKSLEIMDLVLPWKAFIKVGKAFASFIGDFLSWALGTVLSLLEIILDVVAPKAVPYVKKAGASFQKILKDPITFVKTLVAAGMLGFNQFRSKFLTHLKNAMVQWLTGAMAGANLYIPKNLNVLEILKFALSVLGLTWANIRSKLVAATNETVVKALETGFDVVKKLVTEGPAAAWEEIVKSLTNLQDMVVEEIKSYVKGKIVEIAVTKLLSMLSPAGAFIQAIIAIWNTIMFFIERIKQIAAVAKSFVDSIITIAAGTIKPAADRVETTMAGMLVLVISFLARFAGLGKVSDAVKKLIDKVRAPIDKGLDRVVAWIVEKARALGRFVAQAGVPHDPQERVKLGAAAGLAIANRFAGRKVGAAALNPLLAAARVRFGLNTLEPVPNGPNGRKWRIVARINPEAWLDSNAELEAQPPGAHEAAIQQLLGIQNKGGREVVITPTARYGAALIETLARIHPKLVSSDAQTRKTAIDEARMNDKVWEVLQGMIYAPFVEAQQAAVAALGAAATGDPFIYSLERGGARLAEQVAQGTGAGVISIAKVRVKQALPGGGTRDVSSKTAHIASLRARIVADLAGDTKAARTVTITETMVGGGSTDQLINMVNDLARIPAYSNVTWKLLLLQQTAQTSDAQARGIVEIREKKVAVPGKIKLIVASTPYIMGEDVGYQSNRALATSKSPVILFKPLENTMYAYQIVPLGATTAADIIADLTAGKYNGRLPNVL